MSLDEFKSAFTRVKRLGWVAGATARSSNVLDTFQRVADTGSYITTEVGIAPVRARRANSKSMITLLTLVGGEWRIPRRDAIRAYGMPDHTGKVGLIFNISRVPNSAALFLDITSEELRIRHIDGSVLAAWSFTGFANQIKRQYPGLVLVDAFSEKRGLAEWFMFDRARLLAGTSANIVRNAISASNIVVDARYPERGSRGRALLLVNEDDLCRFFDRWDDI